MVTRSHRGVTLALVEVLLLTVMVVDAASGQQTIKAKPTDVVPGRADRLFFRHVTARSIYYNVPRITNDSRTLMMRQDPRGVSALLRPVREAGAPSLAAPGKPGAPVGSLGFGFAAVQPARGRLVATAEPARDAQRAAPQPAARQIAAKPAAAAEAPPAKPDETVAAAQPAAVLRNRDVLPDRNLNTVKPQPATADAKPYDPTGMTVGSFLVKPAVEIQAGYDTNPTRRNGGQGSPVAIVATEVAVRSQWERHQLNADFRGAYTEDTNVRSLSHPTFEARAQGRYDVAEGTAITGEARFVNDALALPGALKLPRATTFGGSAGVLQKIGPAEIAFKGSADRVVFNDAVITANVPLRTQDRNYTQPGAQVRVTYVLTPNISPFVDMSFDRRNHDLQVDFNGQRRDSSGITARGGAVVNMGSLTGEASVGYLTRRMDSPLMPNVSGVIADATLAWAATDTTTFVLVARSQASETPALNVSGILSRDVILQMDHQFEPWLIGTLRGGYGQDQFVGIGRVDQRMFVAAGGTYKMNRNVQLKSEVRTEWTRSNIALNNFMAVVGVVGVRVQY
ncbi:MULTISPECIES: outer membrane beta-barrel protein [unclassified Bradyrhizobium]|uniref:outer membrane beta-barrel protein n=1 Tax=unclassified Bradyrhizobium TaxID=2631580 RepID=UPI0028EB5405|nr:MULTISPECIES: outer membrane beta-barrel protein [unclassified Bradyrhizobium]